MIGGGGPSRGHGFTTVQERGSLKPKYRTLLIVIASFCAGISVAWGMGYFLVRPGFEFIATAPYQQAASTGKLYVKMLRSLCGGQTELTISSLELLVDGQAILISNYEKAIRAELRDPYVYSAARIMPAYRLEYPTTQTDAKTRELINQGLALGDEQH